MAIVTLAHHVDLVWMYEAYRQTRKDGAVGCDKVTAAEYAADLDRNLRSLLERFKSGRYFAPPVRRVQIPKGDGSKTRPIGIAFGRTQGLTTGKDGGKPPTFDFLGLTHYWARSRKGTLVVKRKTARKRRSRALKRVAEWCKRNRHLPVDQQQRHLAAMLLGHYGYFGVTGNNRALGAFWYQVKRIWHVWLRRRSQRRRLTWEGFARLLKRYPLPPPKIVHSIYRPQANPCS